MRFLNLKSNPLTIRAEYRRIVKKIVIDPKIFKPCEAKVEEAWSWKKLKTEKWVIHVDQSGMIRTKKIGEAR